MFGTSPLDARLRCIVEGKSVLSKHVRYVFSENHHSCNGKASFLDRDALACLKCAQWHTQLPSNQGINW